MDEDPLVGAMLSRLDNIAADASGNTQHERYTYLGVGTIVQVERPAVTGGLTLSYGTSANHYSAPDRFGRVKDQVWTGSGGDVSSHSYAFDDNSNITADANNLASEFSEEYTFDDLDRLVDANRDSGNFQHWTLPLTIPPSRRTSRSTVVSARGTFAHHGDAATGAGAADAAVREDIAHGSAETLSVPFAPVGHFPRGCCGSTRK